MYVAADKDSTSAERFPRLEIRRRCRSIRRHISSLGGRSLLCANGCAGKSGKIIYLDMQKKGYSEKFWVPRFFFIAIRCTFDIYINCSTIITFQYFKTYMQSIATI